MPRIRKVRLKSRSSWLKWGSLLVPRPSGDLTIERTVGVTDLRLRVLVAAGTGIAPFVSTLRTHAVPGSSDGPGVFALLHGVRTAPNEQGEPEADRSSNAM